MNGTTPAALFEPAADGRVVATELSRGPWDPRHCHGGPVAALLVREVERTEPGDVAWQVARLTVELTRPVPVGRPLAVQPVVERPGARVSVVAVTLTDDGTEVARARALRIRSAHVAIPDQALGHDVLTVGPDHATARPSRFAAGDDVVSFARDACEHRFVEGSWDELGPVALWMRLRVPVMADEVPSGAQRAVATADFGNGVSRTLEFESHLFINPDLTVHLLRPPLGEWIGMRASTHHGGEGAGLAESRLYDERGIVGRGVQSLYVDRR